MGLIGYPRLRPGKRYLPIAPVTAVPIFFDFTTGSLPSGATLTRAGTAYRMNVAGLLVAETTDVARFDYNATSHAALGLLYEPAATNVLLQSQAVGTGPWTAGGANTVSANVIVAPDGTTTVDKIIASVASGNQFQNQNVATAPAGTWYYSEVVKAAEYGNTILVTSGDGSFPQCTFNLSTQVATIAGSNITAAGVEDYGSGFYRVWILFTTSGTGCTFYVCPAPSATYAFAGNASSGGYVWQGQAEQNKLTSIIPTTSGSATRAADVLVLNWGGQGVADGAISVQYTFDDNSTQTVAGTVASGTMTVPTTLNRTRIKRAQKV